MSETDEATLMDLLNEYTKVCPEECERGRYGVVHRVTPPDSYSRSINAEHNPKSDRWKLRSLLESIIACREWDLRLLLTMEGFKHVEIFGEGWSEEAQGKKPVADLILAAYLKALKKHA